MPARILSVKIMAKSKEAERQLEDIISSVDGFSVLKEEQTGNSDILILEVIDPPEKDFQFANVAQKTGRARSVFLTSAITQPEILLEAFKLGIKGFFPQPLERKYVQDALINYRGSWLESDEGKSASSEVELGQIINFFGSKGGVGTTTLAVNLAVSLAARKEKPRVALLDMNSSFGEVSMFLNIESAFDWVEVAKNIDRLDATYLMSTLTRHESGVHVLPSPIRLIEGYRTNPHVLETMLQLLQSMFDYVILDSGQSLDDNTKSILKMSDLTMLVFIASLPCLINLKRILETFQGLGYPAKDSVEIVVNRSLKSAEISQKEIESSLKKKVYFTFPNDYRNTMSSINQGKPLADIDGKSEICQRFNEFASLVIEREKRGSKSQELPNVIKKGKLSLFVNNLFKS